MFAKALILFEGQTEDQVVPAFFERWFNATAFSKGVNLTAVNGRNYAPYVKLALSLGIPVAIVSDNDSADEQSTKEKVDAQVAKTRSETSLEITADWFFLEYLSDSNDFEAEIVKACAPKDEIVDAFVEIAKGVNAHPGHLTNKRKELEALSEDRLIEKMRNAKTFMIFCVYLPRSMKLACG